MKLSIVKPSSSAAPVVGDCVVIVIVSMRSSTPLGLSVWCHFLLFCGDAHLHLITL